LLTRDISQTLLSSPARFILCVQLLARAPPDAYAPIAIRIPKCDGDVECSANELLVRDEKRLVAQRKIRMECVVIGVHATMDGSENGRFVDSRANCGLRRSELPFKREVREVYLIVIGGQPHF
jgi:hypothetical protein